MNNFELYHVCSSVAERDADVILKEFSPYFTWSENENILDVGCGPGDVTAKVLRPFLPTSANLLSVDISPKSLELAKKNYSSENIQFKLLDITTKNITDVFKEREFSKIFCFHVIHWIKDLEQTVKNFRSLLQPGGQFLTSMIPSSYHMFQMYKVMKEMDEWKDYLKDADNFVPSFNSCEDIKQLLTSQGLDVVRYKEQINIFTYPNMQAVKQLYMAVNPFTTRMSEETCERYMACHLQLLKKHGTITELDSGEVSIKFPSFAFFGRRPVTDE